MKFLPDEQILFGSGSLVITTHRVRLETNVSENAQLISIMLEELSSCAVTRTSNTGLLALAGLCLVIGLVMTAIASSAGPLIIGVILGLVFYLMYLASRQQIISLASAGHNIRVSTSKMSIETAKDVIEKAESAKNARHLLLRGS